MIEREAVVAEVAEGGDGEDVVLTDLGLTAAGLTVAAGGGHTGDEGYRGAERGPPSDVRLAHHWTLLTGRTRVEPFPLLLPQDYEGRHMPWVKRERANVP